MRHIDLWGIVHMDFPNKIDKRISKLKRLIDKKKQRLLHQIPEREEQEIRKNCQLLRIRIEELKKVRNALYQELAHHVGNYCNKITSDEILEIE